MDLVLGLCDKYFFTPFVYPTSWPENYLLREFLSLWVISTVFGYMLYFALAGASYFFVFNHHLLKHPLALENQVAKEIMLAIRSIWIMAIFTSVMFVLEVRGYGLLYDGYPNWPYLFLSIAAFILFTDFCIYWIHRGLHYPWFYKIFHKDHHKWKIPTPFASHAFHPVDGFVQSLPYHLFVFLLPLHKIVYLALFMFVNLWTVMIHDGDYRVPILLRPIVNGSAHHTDHHLFYNCNYGQFLTLWDRIGGSFREPSAFQKDGINRELNKNESTTEKKSL